MTPVPSPRPARNRSLLAIAGSAVAGSAVVGLVVLATAIASGVAIVAPDGHVGGRGYAQWLGKWWQVALSTPPGGPICQRSGDVELLMATPFGKGPNRCTVPGTRIVYVNGPAGECSTVEKPPNHGGTDAELKACAQRSYKAVSQTSLTIDGEAVPHLDRWTVATPVYAFTLPKQNILAATTLHGRSAAYGVGFLIKGLAPGIRVIRLSGSDEGHSVVLTYRIRVLPLRSERPLGH